MYNYSFKEYDQKTHYEAGTNHNTLAYDFLAISGELCELIQVLLPCLPKPQMEEEFEALLLIEEFVLLASEMRSFTKEVRHKQIGILADCQLPDDKTPLMEELGGCVWYLNALAKRSGLSLEDCAKYNERQLNERFEQNPDWMTKP